MDITRGVGLLRERQKHKENTITHKMIIKYVPGTVTREQLITLSPLLKENEQGSF